MQQVAFSVTIDTALIRSHIEAWRKGHPAGGFLLLLAEADKEKVPALQQLFREADTPMCGGIFPELVYGNAFHRKGVLLIGCRTMPRYRMVELEGEAPWFNATIDALHKETFAAPAAAAGTLFLIFDAMVPTIASVLQRLYTSFADQLQYVGVNAGSETFQPMPCLFDRDRLIGGGVLALMLPHDETAALEHGYRGTAETKPATSTSGNRIITIDWRPAFEVYQELVANAYGAKITRENFYQYGVHFPFGILRATGEIIVRIPVALADDGSLFCVGEIPPNAMLVLLEAPQVDSQGAVDAIAGTMGAQREDFLLEFYCAGRRMHLGQAASGELAALHARLPRALLAGALSLGEIGSTMQGGYPIFHNATIVCCTWRS